MFVIIASSVNLGAFAKKAKSETSTETVKEKVKKEKPAKQKVKKQKEKTEEVKTEKPKAKKVKAEKVKTEKVKTEKSIKTKKEKPAKVKKEKPAKKEKVSENGASEDINTETEKVSKKEKKVKNKKAKANKEETNVSNTEKTRKKRVKDLSELSQVEREKALLERPYTHKKRSALAIMLNPNLDITEIRASHILVKKRKDAVSIRKDIMSGTITFEEAARRYSLCPTGINGGDLGYFNRQRMEQQFTDRAFDLKVGQVSDPVGTKFGWHLIKVFDKR